MSNNRYTYLIIEDDPAFVEILKVVVSKLDHLEAVGISDNTLDAAKMIEFNKPDILLLDINISGLEGPEVVELSDHKPKTIIISSHPQEVMENYDIEYVQYIQKPIANPSVLESAIQECIDQINS